MAMNNVVQEGLIWDDSSTVEYEILKAMEKLDSGKYLGSDELDKAIMRMARNTSQFKELEKSLEGVTSSTRYDWQQENVLWGQKLIREVAKELYEKVVEKLSFVIDSLE